MVIHTPDDLNALLAKRRYCANGKNLPVGHLYETVAASRWPHENLLGIYLTNPDHAWMAVWMAITRRDRLRKRQLRYLRPAVDAGDSLGRIEIYDPARAVVSDVFCDRAFLYLFDQDRFAGASVVDISGENDKVAALERRGFRRQIVERRGWAREGYVPDSAARQVVIVDAWQIAVVNAETMAPDVQVTLAGDLIRQLSPRVTFCSDEIGEAYLV